MSTPACCKAEQCFVSSHNGRRGGGEKEKQQQQQSQLPAPPVTIINQGSRAEAAHGAARTAPGSCLRGGCENVGWHGS